MHGIKQDHERFRQIIRGSFKKNIRKYISHQDILSRRGKKTISIPIKKLNLPRFTWGNPGDSGVGQGDPQQGPPSDEAHDNALEVEVTLDELADILGEELQLPKILPKGKSDIVVETKKYNTLRKVGPESLRYFKKTFKQALIRSIISDEYDPDDPIIIPIKDDKRYRAATKTFLPNPQALIIYVMDVSASMGEMEKRFARITSFWIDLWLRKNYKSIKSKYIIHNTLAKEVDQNTFYRTREGGGTRIASAYEHIYNMLRVEYNPADWNIYIFQYSDGDDYAFGKAQACDVLEQLLPSINQLAYCQVRGPNAYGSGEFLKSLESKFMNNDKVVWASVDSEDRILDAIKEFFYQGK